MRFRNLIINAVLAFPAAAGTLNAQDTWGPSGMMGQPTSSSGRELTCPTGKYVIGFQIQSGWYVHNMKVECARLGPSGEHQAIVMLDWYIGGGSSGQAHQSRCPSGKVVVGFKGRAGMWIDRVQVGCRTWKTGTGTEGTTQWLGAWGGTGGELYGPITCPGHMAVYQMKGDSYSNPLMLQVGVGMYKFWCKSA